MKLQLPMIQASIADGESFPGNHAGASLKQPRYSGPLNSAFRASFPGNHAGASLKPFSVEGILRRMDVSPLVSPVITPGPH